MDLQAYIDALVEFKEYSIKKKTINTLYLKYLLTHLMEKKLDQDTLQRIACCLGAAKTYEMKNKVTGDTNMGDFCYHHKQMIQKIRAVYHKQLLEQIKVR